MSFILTHLDKIVAALVLCAPWIYKSFRSNRINDANKEWINCLIFLVVKGIPFCIDGLHCIKTGIAEMHNIYTAEMLSEEAAMRAACGIIVNNPNYSDEQRSRFFLLYPDVFSKMQKCNFKEKEPPFIYQRRITFFFMLIYLTILAILNYYQEIRDTFINGKLFSISTFEHIWTFLSLFIVFSSIFTLLEEKFFPPKVNYHTEYQI